MPLGSVERLGSPCGFARGGAQGAQVVVVSPCRAVSPAVEHKVPKSSSSVPSR